jgi:hypothetical protein
MGLKQGLKQMLYAQLNNFNLCMKLLSHPGPCLIKAFWG